MVSWAYPLSLPTQYFSWHLIICLFQVNENNVQVALDTFSWGRVSTIFLGKDYSNFPNQEPQLFETMVFGGEYSGKFWRYSTWEQAVAGHQEVCMIAI